MFIILFVLALIICAAALKSLSKSPYADEPGWIMLVGIVLMLFSIVASALTIDEIMYIERTIPTKIEIYEAENDKIEGQISDLVKCYMKHEDEVFEKAASKENAITLVNLYPKLKSDKLVKKQIDIYVENNKEIKEMKARRANLSRYRFLLYLGH